MSFFRNAMTALVLLCGAVVPFRITRILPTFIREIALGGAIT